ncbi:16S rRNA (cytosine(967)-C(5))-methyltransferase RsmB [Sporolactobacillus putidus]|uniref:16S rRNA (cytosine(967)-C(5))-methyltransferase n=1 Tax=Sporolactobacillus putidus TaxID=492735 RepID=A0A917VY62_9BACL|nr:16S rRNA (cytosine(967)-C(5))-methyltransferase RsmB [Sporolactobacillus putidus]GGL44359.1 ribosomal RNA small subunit methyltransferase B [Sporolactobacillus putidus]
MKRSSVRETALDLLLSITKNHAYSQLALNDTLSESSLSARDRALVTTIVYGVLQRRLTLDYVLSAFAGSERRLDEWVRLLLQLSFYQKLYLDRIPDHAIVNEAVSIANHRGHRGIAGFVNGVLRQFLRKGAPDLSAILPEGRRLSIQYSTPEWLLDMWKEQWDIETSLKIAEAGNLAPHTFIRANRLKISRQALAQRLAKEGVRTSPGELSHECLRVEEGQPAATEAYKEGLLTIQDESSMLVADALAPAPGMAVLDACAAPGGKTAHLAERMENSGKIVALDLHEQRTKLIDAAAARLGISIIETRAMDARNALGIYGKASFDRVLLDAPCSGLGVIRRKPEIKWEKTFADTERLASIQQSILEAAAPLVRPGGWLVYSTCTINRAENDDLLNRFLSEHDDFYWEPVFFSRFPAVIQNCRLAPHTSMVQLLPFQFGTDGFFIGCLKKKKK